MCIVCVYARCVCVVCCVCGACVRVCLSNPKGINNQWHDMVRYRMCVIGQTNFMASAFHLLYVTIAADKMDGCGLSTMHILHTKQKKMKLMLTYHRSRRIDYLAVARRQSTSVIK